MICGTTAKTIVCSRLAPVACYSFQRPFHDALDLFGIQLRQGGDGVQAQGQRTGKRSKPDPGHEDNCHHQGFDRACAVQDGADDRVDHHPDGQ